MARARFLRPDFFEDEKLTAMPFGARLLFQAYWVLADREGRLEDRPSRIAAFAFPPMGNEPLQAQARRGVPAWRELLIGAGMVQAYEVDGEAYLQLVNFKKHQKVHPNESKSVIPPPLVTNGVQPLMPLVTNDQQFTPASTSTSTSTSTPTFGARAVARTPPNKDNGAEPKELTDEYVTVLAGRHPDIDVGRERQKFEDYNAAKGRRFRDYGAAFRNWLANAEDFKHEKVQRNAPGAGAGGARPSRDELIAEYEAYARGE